MLGTVTLTIRASHSTVCTNPEWTSRVIPVAHESSSLSTHSLKLPLAGYLQRTDTENMRPSVLTAFVSINQVIHSLRPAKYPEGEPRWTWENMQSPDLNYKKTQIKVTRWCKEKVEINHYTQVEVEFMVLQHPLMTVSVDVHGSYIGVELILKRLQQRFSVFWVFFFFTFFFGGGAIYLARKALSHSNSVPPGHKSLSLEVLVLFKRQFGFLKGVN